MTLAVGTIIYPFSTGGNLAEDVIYTTSPIPTTESTLYNLYGSSLPYTISNVSTDSEDISITVQKDGVDYVFSRENNPAFSTMDKTITQNGIYLASDDEVMGYSSVTVNIPIPTGNGGNSGSGAGKGVLESLLDDLVEGSSSIDTTGLDAIEQDIASAYGKADVTESITITPSAKSQTIVPELGLYGFSSVTVEPAYVKQIKNKSIITVIDLDGTIIDYQGVKEGETYTLPTPPSHPCLTFCEWSSTAPITNNTVTAGKTDIMIGAVYKPKASSSYTPTKQEVILLHFYQANQTITLGGTSTQELWNVDVQNFNNYSGKLSFTETAVPGYSSYLYPAIDFTATEPGLYYIPLGTTYSTVPNIYRGSSVYDVFGGATPNIEGIVFPEMSGNISFQDNGFLGHYYSSNYSYDNHLKFVGLPYGATRYTMDTSGSCTCYCPELEVMIVPSTVTTGFTYGIFDIHTGRPAENLKYIVAPNAKLFGSVGTATTASSLAYSKMESMHIANNNTILAGKLFYNCTRCLEYDFTDFESVPTLQGVDAFYGINPNCEIKVPALLYEDWIAATNWSAYANYIIGV